MSGSRETALLYFEQRAYQEYQQNRFDFSEVLQIELNGVLFRNCIRKVGHPESILILVLAIHAYLQVGRNATLRTRGIR